MLCALIIDDLRSNYFKMYNCMQLAYKIHAHVCSYLSPNHFVAIVFSIESSASLIFFLLLLSFPLRSSPSSPPSVFERGGDVDGDGEKQALRLLQKKKKKMKMKWQWKKQKKLLCIGDESDQLVLDSQSIVLLASHLLLPILQTEESVHFSSCKYHISPVPIYSIIST